MKRSPSRVIQVLIAVVLGVTLAASRAQAVSLSFAVSFTPQVRSTRFTGRILVFSGTGGTVYALDVQQLAPGESVLLDEHALGFPAPPGAWPSRPTRFQAVLDQALDDWQISTAPGNGISASVLVQPPPTAWVPDTPVPLVIDRLIPTRKFVETSRVKLVDIPSPVLTQFYQRPMQLRGGVILPEGYLEEPEKRFPVVYYIPGFGGNHFEAFDVLSSWRSLGAKTGPNALVVVLDPMAHTGHHSFADSANNGPFGTALVEEMLPSIDGTFRTVGQPAGRLLTGHSSGGWSSLWLQSTYPERFGGVWSTSPDPVDFRDFWQVDLYTPGANLFFDPQGGLRPLARSGAKPTAYIQPYSDEETVLGHGGFFQSYDAVFSPRGADGQPRPLYDRRSGAIDPAVAQKWSQYDISRKLTGNWSVLGTKLAGKLHIYTGSLDSFYLEGAVRLLKQALAPLGSDAVIEIVPGKDHGTLRDAKMQTRISQEMVETLRRAGIGSDSVP